MLRLFISLYLFIVIGLYAINTCAEWLWQHVDNTTEISNTKLDIVLSILPRLLELPETFDNEQLASLSHDKVKLSSFAVNDIAWLPEQQARLLSGQVVSSYPIAAQADNTVEYFVYLKTSNKVLSIIVNPPEYAHVPVVKYLIIALSYCLLAALIGIFLWPIWRDVKQLESITSWIEQGQFNKDFEVNKHSPTYVVVETFKQMTERITGLIKEQRDLINAVSHELRTPLSRIRFSLAMSNDIPSKQLQEITIDVNEIEQLVDEILDYSRIENLLTGLSASDVNLSDLLLHLVERLQRGTTKTIAFQIEESLLFSCDGHLIERACQNLLTNAIRYSQQQVMVTLTGDKQKIDIIIEDDGAGVYCPEPTLLFQPFYRADKSRNKKQGGYGLGLAIVKRIVDLHGGQCDIGRSEQLGGAKFSITLTTGLRFKV